MLLRCYTSHFLVFSPRFSAFIATKKFTYVHFSSHPINTTFFVQLWNRCSDGCFFFSTELQATKELREVLLTNFCCLFAINLLLFPSIEMSMSNSKELPIFKILIQQKNVFQKNTQLKLSWTGWTIICWIFAINLKAFEEHFWAELSLSFHFSMKLCCIM